MNDATNPLSKLVLDYWYKVIMAVSSVTFILCGMGLLVAFPVALTASVSGGMFFIGLGEWVNHPLQTKILPANAYYPAGKITGHPRNNSFIGVFFVFIGLAIACGGIYFTVA
jgi:hypothetical protein